MRNQICEISPADSSKCNPLTRTRLWNLFPLLIALAWQFGLGSAPARAQTEDSLESIGVQPFTALLPVPSGYINLANSDLHLEIPLGSFPQRAGPPVKFVLKYDSSIWIQDYTYIVGWFARNNGGWRLYNSADSGSAFSTIQTSVTCRIDGMVRTYTWKGFQWTDADMTVHSYPNMSTTEGFKTSCGDDTSSSKPAADGAASDASGYHMYVTSYTNVKVIDPDGNVVFGGIDTNGNMFSADSSGNLPMIVSTRI